MQRGDSLDGLVAAASRFLLSGVLGGACEANFLALAVDFLALAVDFLETVDIAVELALAVDFLETVDIAVELTEDW